MVNSATNYLNSKGRRIFKSDRGAFYSVSADGKKVYGVKAAFRKAGGDGARVKITAKRNNTTVIPNKIRPAVRTRSDAGKARGPRPGTLQRRMNANSRRLAAARAKPKRIVGNGRVTTRKVRSNKGVARGPAGPRKPRSNKGVARGPRPGALQRRMNTNAAKKKPAGARKVRKNAGAVAKMAKLITPTEDELYRMIFGSPKPRKATAKKAAAPKRKTAAKKKAAPKRKAASPLNMILRSGRRTR